MPKSVDVEDFAAKLALLAKRLNWSRAKLAQQVGVDKSLAARWLNGNSRPTGNSLMQLTSAVAQAIDGFTAADWDLSAEQFSRRLGIETAPRSPAERRDAPARLTLSGLRNPPPAATWGAAYLGLWAGFYQSLTNRGVARLCVSEFAIGGDGMRLSHTDGFFTCEGAAVATHNHLHAICEIVPLDNHLIFFAFNAAQDMQGVAVIDGLKCGVGPDDTPSAVPLVLFRIDDAAGDPPSIAALTTAVARANDRIESERLHAQRHQPQWCSAQSGRRQRRRPCGCRPQRPGDRDRILIARCARPPERIRRPGVIAIVSGWEH